MDQLQVPYSEQVLFAARPGHSQRTFLSRGRSAMSQVHYVHCYIVALSQSDIWQRVHSVTFYDVTIGVGALFT